MRFQNDGKERRNHVTTRQSYFSQNGVCSVTGRVTYVPHRSTRGHDAHVDTTHTWTRHTHVADKSCNTTTKLVASPLRVLPSPGPPLLGSPPLRVPYS